MNNHSDVLDLFLVDSSSSLFSTTLEILKILIALQNSDESFSLSKYICRLVGPHMTFSGMDIALKASTHSSTSQQHWLHSTRYRCQYGLGSTHLNGRKRSPMVLSVRAVSGKSDLDFSDPSWKEKYQEDWNRRFSLPHITDIYDLKPRLTTFSLKKNRFIRAHLYTS